MSDRDEDKERDFPGYLWRPGSSPQDNSLLLVVAVVIALVIIGVVPLSFLG
ncbi:hypothetical protein AFL01nite_04560 [Aeromicrobium flavum]|uniref:Uncharacterized protein n=1 Tax=Aeromicrobium flavum TaxID=416568 RepID=A0A512HRP8_9ACTN|nr:hypothetical protein [Aeromicrobium flavum]GEO88129.1 hypothetical protein AFL01nite_04560 [Aeromicrobium flavum]